jgi:hypothetical protein
MRRSLLLRCAFIIFNRRRFKVRRQCGQAKFRTCTHPNMRAMAAAVAMRGIDCSDMTSSTASGRRLNRLN